MILAPFRFASADLKGSRGQTASLTATQPSGLAILWEAFHRLTVRGSEWLPLQIAGLMPTLTQCSTVLALKRGKKSTQSMTSVATSQVSSTSSLLKVVLALN